MHSFHRQRREDQNLVMGYPPDRWKPWAPFPTYEVMIRNAINEALRGWEIETETGERLVLSKGEVVVKKLVKNRPTVQGSRDPHMPGHILVPLERQHSTLPAVRNAPLSTYYRYNERKARVECMVTVMPNGLDVAWDTCGGCALHIRACTCVSVQPGRSIHYIYEVLGGIKVEMTAAPVPKIQPKLTKSPPPAAPLKKLQKDRPALIKRPVTVDENISLSDYEDDAKKLAKSSTAALMKVIGGKSKLTKG